MTNKLFSSPKEIIQCSGEMATLPSIYQKVNDAVENPETSFSSIAKIISGDPGLSGRLLQIVNSSFYGLKNQVETITHAITIIGSAQLRDLVLATTILEKFKGFPESTLNMKMFWIHSLACGLAARIIATLRRQPNTEKFYVLGILHDLGRLVMLTAIEKEMKEVFQFAMEEDILLHNAEEEILGFNHSDVGGELINSWELSNSFCVAVTNYHDPSKGKSFEIETAILHFSDILVHAIEVGSSGELRVPPLNGKAWEKIGLPSNTLPGIVSLLEVQIQDSMQMFLR